MQILIPTVSGIAAQPFRDDTWARVKFTVRTTVILEGTPYCVVYACFREKGVAALETLLEQGQWW